MKKLIVLGLIIIVMISLCSCTNYCNYKDCMEPASSNGYCSYHKNSSGGSYSKKCPGCKRYHSGFGTYCWDCIYD